MKHENWKIFNGKKIYSCIATLCKVSNLFFRVVGGDRDVPADVSGASPLIRLCNNIIRAMDPWWFGIWRHTEKNTTIHFREEGESVWVFETLQTLHLNTANSIKNFHTVRFRHSRCSSHHILYTVTSACRLLSLRKLTCDVIRPMTSLITHSLLVITESQRECITVGVPTKPNPTDVPFALLCGCNCPLSLSNH